MAEMLQMSFQSIIKPIPHAKLHPQVIPTHVKALLNKSTLSNPTPYIQLYNLVTRSTSKEACTLCLACTGVSSDNTDSYGQGGAGYR